MLRGSNVQSLQGNDGGGAQLDHFPLHLEQGESDEVSASVKFVGFHQQGPRVCEACKSFQVTPSSLCRGEGLEHGREGEGRALEPSLRDKVNDE